MDILRQELNRVFSSMRERQTLVVVIAGWQWTRRSPRLRGVSWTLSNEDTSEFTLNRHSRFSAADGTVAIGSHPSLPPHEARQLRRAITDARGDVEQVLTSTVAQRAMHTSTVGPDSMVIRLVPSQPPHVRARFNQAAPPRAVIRYKDRDNSLAYAPWVVTKDCLWHPAVIAGGKIATSCGGIDVEVGGSDDANYGGFWPQRRTAEHGPLRHVPIQWPPPSGIIAAPPDAGQS